MDFEKLKSDLKKEFIGIDQQIDNLVDLIRPWYNNPELYDSPCIINLWGMTGHGKTSLVNRIIDLLGEGHNRMYMNCHSMLDMDLYFMETFVEDTATNPRSNKFIIFDDFQYVRTIDEEGHESSSSALSVMWNLMDTGVIANNFYASHFKLINKIRSVLNNIEDPDAIIGGVFANPKEYVPLKYFANPDISPFEVKSSTQKKKTSKKSLSTKDPYEPIGKIISFLSDDTLSSVTFICRQIGIEDCEDGIEFMSSRADWNAIQWKDFFNDIYDRMKRGKNRDFHNSIIFVIGNIDEAFCGLAKEVNPEMSADMVNEITSNVNIVDIKKGLQKRFRNEQIARLGNTHIIYPSLTTASYKAIIEKHLNIYVSRFKANYPNVDLVFDDSTKQCIYDEGVFPAQGVRPLFSTINDIIKINIPKVCDVIKDENLDVDCITVSFDLSDKSLLINLSKDGNAVSDVIKIPVILRVRDSYRDNAESVANTSVHESGHFVLYKYLTGNAPVKVISRSLDQSCLGYMMEKFDEGVTSKRRLMDEIVVCLGGYAAEQLVFGKDFQSSGAWSDIEDATSIAVSIMNQWGLHGTPATISVSDNADNEKTIMLTERERFRNNTELRRMMSAAYDKATAFLSDNSILRECFKDAFTRLNAKGELTDEDIAEISAKIETAQGYDPLHSTFYQDALKGYK
jgi:cell division protease FtsH